MRVPQPFEKATPDLSSRFAILWTVVFLFSSPAQGFPIGIASNYAVAAASDHVRRHSKVQRTVRYTDHGEDYDLELDLDKTRQGGGVDGLGKTNGEYRRFWDTGDIEFSLHRSLGSFSDPLKLYDDFKTTKNKKAVKLSQRFRSTQLTSFAFHSSKPQGAHELGYAGRLEALLNPNLELGLSYVEHMVEHSEDALTQNRAFGLDLTYQLSAAHRVALQPVATVTHGAESLHGYGSRVSWDYERTDGLKLRLGHLVLSKAYDAVLSNPGNGVTNDVSGPEASLAVPFSGPWMGITGGELQANVYSYKRSEPKRKQCVDLHSRFGFWNRFTITTKFREQQQNGAKSTDLQLAEHHRLTSNWLGTTEVTETKTSLALTRTLRLEATRSDSQHLQRYSLHLTDKSADTSGASEISAGLSTSGRFRDINYQGLVQYTRADDESGIYPFLRIAYEEPHAETSRPNVYVAIGDPKASGPAAQFEVGMDMPF